MGLFEHHESAPESAEFMGLLLDGEALSTPAGVMPLRDITKADFVRDIMPDGHGPEEVSTEAVVGGAVVGAALFGGIGAVAGGLAGSTVQGSGSGASQDTSRASWSSKPTLSTTEWMSHGTRSTRPSNSRTL